MVPFLLIKLHDILYVHLHKVKVTLQKGIFRIVKSSTSASIASKISSEKGIFHITSRKMQNVSMGYFLVLVCIQFFFTVDADHFISSFKPSPTLYIKQALLLVYNLTAFATLQRPLRTLTRPLPHFHARPLLHSNGLY
jgi:hypothetical protein